jgi:hypothetical protein
VKTIADPEVLQSLSKRLNGLRPESARHWGTLTAHEMLCHLGDSSEMVLRIRPRDKPIVPRRRRVVKWFGLWTPMRWPHGWKTSPAHDPRLAGTRPSAFEKDLKRALDSLGGLARARAGGIENAHGFFGTMSLLDWQRWAYKHTDHHLRQFGL